MWIACCRRDLDCACGSRGCNSCQNTEASDELVGAQSVLSADQEILVDGEVVNGATSSQQQKVNSRTPLKTQYCATHPYDDGTARVEGKFVDGFPDLEASCQKMVNLLMTARSPKVVCLAGTGVCLFLACMFFLIQGWLRPATTTITTTSYLDTRLTRQEVASATGDAVRRIPHEPTCDIDHSFGTQLPAVCLDLIVEGVDHAVLALNSTTQTAFKVAIAKGIAAQAGHGAIPSDVHLILTKGSPNHVLVKAALVSERADAVRPMHDALQQAGRGFTRKLASYVPGAEDVVLCSLTVFVPETGGPAIPALLFFGISGFPLAKCFVGGLVVVVCICVGVMRLFCCAQSRSDIEVDEQSGSPRHLQRREPEGLEANVFDSQLEEFYLDSAASHGQFKERSDEFSTKDPFSNLGFIRPKAPSGSSSPVPVPKDLAGQSPRTNWSQVEREISRQISEDATKRQPSELLAGGIGWDAVAVELESQRKDSKEKPSTVARFS